MSRITIILASALALGGCGIDTSRCLPCDCDRAQIYGACTVWDDIAVRLDHHETAEREAGRACREAGYVWSWERPAPPAARPEVRS